jgi:Tfp pilus assembly protein PilE
MKNVKGITLIELIIFILVGGIFVPLAYIAFTAVIRDSTTPETLVKARFVTEAKIEDITKEAYDAIPLPSAYVAVNTDSRFTDVSYNGYQWKWEITDIAYQDNATHTTTTVRTPISWTVSTVYKVGDYIQPVTPTGNFYRVYFPPWQANNTYNLGDMVRPTVSNNHYYKCVKPPPWQPNTNYMVGNLVRPTVENGHYYRAQFIWGSSTLNEPTWPTSPSGICFWEKDWAALDFIYWCEFTTMTSDSSPPTWPTGTSQIVFDYRVTWQENTTLTSGSSQPTIWRTDNIPFPDNSVSWVRSMVYKLIKVYVRPPNCSNDACAYIATSMVTGRNYTTRP